MPFFFADRKILYQRDYLTGVGMPLIRQDAHKPLNFNGSREVNFGNRCRSLGAFEVIVRVCPVAQLASISPMI